MTPCETVVWACALLLLIIDYGRYPRPVQGTSIYIQYAVCILRQIYSSDKHVVSVSTFFG